MMRLTDPLKIAESEFNEFINEFKTAREDLVPYSLNQKNLDFHNYIKSLKDESLGQDIPENWVPSSTYFLINNEFYKDIGLNYNKSLPGMLKARIPKINL